MARLVKNPSANAGDVGDAGSIPGRGRSPGGRHGSPLQYYCLENLTDRRAWRTTVYRVAKSWTRLKRFRTHTRTESKNIRLEVKSRSVMTLWHIFMKQRLRAETEMSFKHKIVSKQRQFIPT